MDKKVIWFVGIPSSGKTTMARRLYRELIWANKKAIFLDDEIMRFILSPSMTKELIGIIGQEYTIIVTVKLTIMPKKPDLIVWCKAPMEVCKERDKSKITTPNSISRWELWKSYFINADLILKTYDESRETSENIEFCWQVLKRKMEELFGNFSWREYSINSPNSSN